MTHTVQYSMTHAAHTDFHENLIVSCVTFKISLSNITQSRPFQTESTDRSSFTPLSGACVLLLDFFVKMFCAECNDNPADSLATRSQREGRTDGRDFHIRRYFSLLFKEHLRRKTGKREVERRQNRSCAVRYITWPVGSRTIALRGCSWSYGVWRSGNT
jgi:hypothetical protein